MANEKKISSLGRFRQRMKIARLGGQKHDIAFLLADAANLSSQEQLIQWLTQVLVWVRLSGGRATAPQVSLRFLFSRLEQKPEWKMDTAHLIHRLLLQSSFVHLFADIGVSSNYDVFNESISRFLRKLFPTFGNIKNIDVALSQIFMEEADADWIASLPLELREQIEKLFAADPSLVEKIRQRLIDDIEDACLILSIRMMALSIQREVMDRSDYIDVHRVPPLILKECLDAYFSLFRQKAGDTEFEKANAEIEQRISASRDYVKSVYRHLEESGVSINLVFSLEAMISILDRLALLVPLARSLRFPERRFEKWSFFVRLLKDIREEQRIRPLWKSTFHLLARKIVERTGVKGENYITTNRGEYFLMFQAALGGGLITAFTGLIKFLGPVSAAPVVMGLYATMNYACSFILMHHLHFKLATKQPTMTAAALAERLKENPAVGNLQEFIDLVARISRSQFAAAAGNIIAVVPTACLIEYMAAHWWQRSIISTNYAMYLLQSMDPLQSLTIVYAALTGILLWLSGIFSGWVENAFVYYRIMPAIKGQNRLVALFGEKSVQWLANSISHNISGWSSSIALAGFLAFVPLLGAFWGLPLDVRHVTLSAGSVTFAVSTLGISLIDYGALSRAVTGILIIGLLNFGVSFAMALSLAVRANSIPRARVRVILYSCGREILVRPKKFFFP